MSKDVTVTIDTAIASRLPSGSGDGYGYGGGAVVTIKGTAAYRDLPADVFSISLVLGELKWGPQIAEHIAKRLQP